MDNIQKAANIMGVPVEPVRLFVRMIRNLQLNGNCHITPIQAHYAPDVDELFASLEREYDRKL